jgi:hypothetical protein
MRTNRKPLLLGVLAGLTALTACARPDDTPADADAPSTEPQEAFWSALHSVCDGAFAGSVEVAPAGDTTFANRELVMHGRECSDDEIRIPFHVGEDRSRTWVITRTDTGLRLKHDHRHEDGTEDAVTQYGGDTRDAGTARRQEFYADAHTAELIPEAVTNVWTIEIEPGQTYVYALRREGTDRRFRIVFDLGHQVDTPPAPWGH